MNKRDVRRLAIAGVMAPMLLLAACAETPMGPTVQVMPAPGKPLDVFAADQAGCRQFAEQAVAGQAQNANNRAVGTAAITTVLGAGLGAAIGGGRGAAIGAGSGALGGAALGAGSSSGRQMSIQEQYNNAYAQCMFTRGNMVPGMGPGAMMQGGPPQGALAPDMSLTRPVQTQLIRLGYMPPPADGTLGPQTSAAISRFQGVAGMPVDGMPSSALLTTLQATR